MLQGRKITTIMMTEKALHQPLTPWYLILLVYTLYCVCERVIVVTLRPRKLELGAIHVTICGLTVKVKIHGYWPSASSAQLVFTTPPP